MLVPDLGGNSIVDADRFARNVRERPNARTGIELRSRLNGIISWVVLHVTTAVTIRVRQPGTQQVVRQVVERHPGCRSVFLGRSSLFGGLFVDFSLCVAAAFGSLHSFFFASSGVRSPEHPLPGQRSDRRSGCFLSLVCITVSICHLFLFFLCLYS